MLTNDIITSHPMHQNKKEGIQGMSASKGNVLGMIGFWAFIVGLIIAVIGGFLPPMGWVIPVLAILGLIIGFLNITAKEMMLFLVATIALIVAGNAFASLKTLGLGDILGKILGYVVALMAPAAIVGAIKALWAVGKPGD